MVVIRGHMHKYGKDSTSVPCDRPQRDRGCTDKLGYDVAMVTAESTDLRSEPENRHPSRGWSVAVFMVALVVFVLSPVRQVSDASYSLLVSESLLRHGTFALDAYVATPLDPAVHPASADGELPYHLMKSGGHFYYAYPPGTSILSVPYVALSHLFGMSAVYPDGGYHYREERRMQLRLAALLMAVFDRGRLSHCRRRSSVTAGLSSSPRRRR